MLRQKYRVLILLPVMAAAIYSQQLQWFTDFKGENAGHTVCGFLNLPRCAAVLGRGSASTPGGVDAVDLPNRSAYTALADRYRFGFTHLEWLMGMRQEYLGAVFPVLDVGTFGCYSQLFTPGVIDNARDINEEPSDPSYIEYSIGATYARSFLNKKLSAGCAVAFVESRIEELTGRSATGSIDLRYAPFSFLSTHFYATSFGKSLSYSGRVEESLPTRIGISALVYPLPTGHPLRKHCNFDIGLGARKTVAFNRSDLRWRNADQAAQQYHPTERSSDSCRTWHSAGSLCVLFSRSNPRHYAASRIATTGTASLSWFRDWGPGLLPTQPEAQDHR